METFEKVAEGMWVRRFWYADGVLCTESWVNSPEPHIIWGPHRVYDLDGHVVGEFLFVEGKQVSLPVYQEARARDPRLPEPTIPAPTDHEYRTFQIARENDSRYVEFDARRTDAFCEKQMRDHKAVRIQHLAVDGQHVLLGERTTRQSANILAKLATLPCKNVFALGPTNIVHTDENVAVTFNDLVIELSDEDVERKKAFRAVRPWVRRQGFDLPRDTGQRFLFLGMK